MLGKIFLCAYVILAMSHMTVSAEDELTQLETHYSNKCQENSGSSTAFSQLRNDVYELDKYSLYAYQYLLENNHTFCNTERSNLTTRIKRIEEDLKMCLSSNEQYLAGFISQSFEQMLNFLCHNNAQYVSVFFSKEGIVCRDNIEKYNGNDLTNCMNNRIFHPSQIILTKSELCGDMTVARKCFRTLVEVSCPSSQQFKNLNEVFFDYVSKPCSSCVNLGNNFVLFVVIVGNFLLLK